MSVISFLRRVMIWLRLLTRCFSSAPRFCSFCLCSFNWLFSMLICSDAGEAKAESARVLGELAF